MPHQQVCYIFIVSLFSTFYQYVCKYDDCFVAMNWTFKKQVIIIIFIVLQLLYFIPVHDTVLILMSF